MEFKNTKWEMNWISINWMRFDYTHTKQRKKREKKKVRGSSEYHRWSNFLGLKFLFSLIPSNLTLIISSFNR